MDFEYLTLLMAGETYLIAVYANSQRDIEYISNTLKSKFRSYHIVGEYVEKNPNKRSFLGRDTAIIALETLGRREGHRIFAVKNLETISGDPLKALEILMEMLHKRDIYTFSVEEPWVYPLLKNNEFLSFTEWVLEQTVWKRRSKQLEAWRKGKRRGRPPAIEERVLRKYVRKYRELAIKNKKALWLLMKGDGYEISYRRFLDKINKILKEI